ncbi:MAG: hypothetical protein M3384_11395 [Acidobacteriota bacterium]|nr:hypothetical protein [Acidobacteriota bacterium]
MLVRKKLLIAMTFLLLLLPVFAVFSVPSAEAKGNEYKRIVKHLKTKYQARKVRIPFLWLARFAVSVARPAGVKSFSITVFENVKFSPETLDAEMQSAMRNSFGKDWNSILRVRSRAGQQAYMYMREDGKNVRITMVTIDKEQAAIIRATFSPEKLAEFVENPKIFGVSLNDNEKQASSSSGGGNEKPNN